MIILSVFSQIVTVHVLVYFLYTTCTVQSVTLKVPNVTNRTIEAPRPFFAVVFKNTDSELISNMET